MIRQQRHGYAILEAPSHLGLRSHGVEGLPNALLAAGLAGRLSARHAGRLAIPAFEQRIDPDTRMLNPDALRDYASELADAVGAVLDRSEFPIVLGGDCSILLGNLLALKRRGRYGLLFIDGHADFYQPEAEQSGEAASMELALVTGRGPEIVTDIEHQRPLVLDDDVVVFGFRDAEVAAAEGSQPLPATLHAIDLAMLRRLGPDQAIRQAMKRLERTLGPDGFWIHFDVDVLDDSIMPAVDYRLAGGLTWAELHRVLQVATESHRASGLDITIFNPTLDADGRIAHDLVDAIVSGLLP